MDVTNVVSFQELEEGQQLFAEGDDSLVSSTREPSSSADCLSYGIQSCNFFSVKQSSNVRDLKVLAQNAHTIQNLRRCLQAHVPKGSSAPGL